MEPLLEGALLCAISIPAFRILLKQAVRNELRARPVLAVAALFVLTLLLVTLAWAWLHSDITRRALVASALVFAVLAFVRSRSNYGRLRGLPPGSLGLALSLDAITDEGFYAQSAARWGPVFKMSQFHRPVICITDLSRGLELLQVESASLAQSQWGMSSLVPGGFVEFMNGDLHARTRRTLDVGFNDVVLADCSPSILALVRQQLAELARAAANGQIDPERCVDRIAFASVLRMVLGVEVAGAQVAELEQLFAPLDRHLDSAFPTPQSVQVAFKLLTEKVTWLAAPANLTLGESAARSVLSEVRKANAMQINDPTVLGNLILLVSNGHGILRSFLRWLLKEIAENPGWMKKLRAMAEEEPCNAAAANELAVQFARETLRVRGSEYVYRVVKRTCWLGPYRLPKGWLLRLCVREAHLRPENFTNPASFDPGRFAARSYDQTEFCPLGHGTHSCPAEQLVMEVARLFTRELALNYDVQVATEGAAERRSRHWQFWRPGHGFRIVLTPRGNMDLLPGAETGVGTAATLPGTGSDATGEDDPRNRPCCDASPADCR